MRKLWTWWEINTFIAPDYKKMFVASIDEMVQALNDENIFLKNESIGQSISKFDKNIRYTLGYNRENALETFKKAYYFPARGIGRKA